MSRTSTVAKDRWNKKTYRQYIARLRKDDDKELIDFIEANKGKYSVTDYLRAGLELYIQDEK